MRVRTVDEIVEELWSTLCLRHGLPEDFPYVQVWGVNPEELMKCCPEFGPPQERGQGV
ncbi:hypothetical protein [Thermus thermophilus]|uniref:Uncharacterized protein n=1 Tax=Thermus thermophilus TaxID=274 RepID=A0A7R7YHS6_THETH|nr:hypothetical protein [Thermus thermophilus]BCP66009.1 hypothetical protein TthHB5018_09430 [Thermus thermophilus]